MSEFRSERGRLIYRAFVKALQHLSAAEAKENTVCLECKHARLDHCCCGSVCMKCSCSRYGDTHGLAPCATCDRADALVRVAVTPERATYRCVRCHPLEEK